MTSDVPPYRPGAPDGLSAVGDGPDGGSTSLLAVAVAVELHRARVPRWVLVPCGASFSNGPLWGDVSTFRVDGLERGTTYTFELRGVNEWGKGAAAVVAGSTFGLPSAPQWLSAEGRRGEILLRWDPPTDNGGSPIRGYAIYRDGERLVSAGVVAPEPTAFTDRGLAKSERHSYSLAAVTIVGEGDHSGSAEGVTLARPVAPRHLSGALVRARVTCPLRGLRPSRMAGRRF